MKSDGAVSRLPVIALVGTSAISHSGNMLTTVAVPWFVLQTTGSAAKTGLTGAVVVIATIIAGTFGGVLVDKIGHKRTSVIADVASGATVAMIPLIHMTVGITFVQLLGLMFLGALLDVPGATARQSLVPDLAERASYQIERVNSALSGATRAAQLVGPVVAGLLIAAFGPTNVLWINAVTFAISAAVVALMIPSLSNHSADESSATAGYFADVLAGFRFIRNDQLLLALISVAAILNFLTNPFSAVILPVYANEVFDSPTELGFMLAAFGGGALLGTLAYGIIGRRLSRRSLLIGSFWLATIPYGILTLTPDLVVTVMSLSVIGITMGPLTPLFMTILQERTPAELRGRIFGFMAASVWIVLPIGMLVAGLLLEHVGLAPTLRIQVIAYLALATGIVIVPALRKMDENGTGHRDVTA